MIIEDNFSDNESCFLGDLPAPPKKPFPWKLLAIIATIVVLISIVIWALIPNSDNVDAIPSEYTPISVRGRAMRSVQPQSLSTDRIEYYSIQPHPLRDWLYSLDAIPDVKIASTDTMVNDIPLHIYVPLNSTPHLEVGRNIATHPESAMLFFEAADVRADNGKIVGAFVLKGESLSRGMSKRGYCAIIGDNVSIGVADNSPLFEQATEQDGDFFRQYPLVDNGMLVENELKNKSIRRALCDIDKHVAVVETQSRESLHDFAQALVDIGVSNAIYLVGGDAMGWATDANGEGYKIGNWNNRQHKNISFIVWSK